jgi:hypothetical protein
MTNHGGDHYRGKGERFAVMYATENAPMVFGHDRHGAENRQSILGLYPGGPAYELTMICPNLISVRKPPL